MLTRNLPADPKHRPKHGTMAPYMSRELKQLTMAHAVGFAAFPLQHPTGNGRRQAQGVHHDAAR